MRRAPLTALLCALGVGLAACGEKDEADATAPVATRSTAATESTTAAPVPRPDSDGEKKPSPEEQVETAIIAVVGGGDALAACRDLVTPAYVKTAYGDEQGCRAAVQAQGTFKVAVEGVEVKGARASARAKPASGPNKGETLTVRLVEDGGTWKVDFLRSNAPAGP